MKRIYLIVCIYLLACSPQKQTTAFRSINRSLAKDSVEYYETNFEVRQKNYIDQIQGQWQLVSMQQQAKLDIETLDHFKLTITKDMKFILSAPCGSINGTYDVKGTGLKFNNLVSSGQTCNSDQWTELMQLLEQRISAYTVTDKELLLRDNATNIVFRAIR